MAISDVTMAIELVADHIEDFYAYISRHEICTRYAAIDPILSALDWDLSDVTEVEVEYEHNQYGRVDYALLNNDDEPAIIIEAKKLTVNGIKVRDERQLLAYAEGMRSGYAILTNGVDWKVWDLSRRGNFQSKLVLELNILVDAPRQCATALNRILRRPLHHKR